MENQNIFLGNQIRKYRKLRKLTQEGLSEKVEISSKHISRIENGKTEISALNLVTIANALQVSTDELLRNSVKDTKPILHMELSNIVKDCSQKELEKLTKIMRAIVEIEREQ